KFANDRVFRTGNVKPGKALQGFFYRNMSPDLQRAVVVNLGGDIRVLNAGTSEVVCTMVGHTKLPHRVVFSPSGKWIVSTSGDKTNRIWDAATGKEMAKLDYPNGAAAFAFSPDSKWLATGSFADKAGQLVIWEI